MKVFFPIWLGFIFFFVPQTSFALENIFFQSEVPGARFRNYTAENKMFTVSIPAKWEITEDNQLDEYDHYELQLFLPDENNFWRYQSMVIAYYAEEFRTPEGYLAEASLQEEDAPFFPVGFSLERGTGTRIKTWRSPLAGMSGDPVEISRTIVTIPAQPGIFVFTFETPEDLFEVQSRLFETVIRSFTPGLKQITGKSNPLSQDEYEVFRGFFATEQFENIEVPEFFNLAFSCQSLYEKTQSVHISAEELTDLRKEYGDVIFTLWEDLQTKNLQEASIKDLFLDPKISMVSVKQMNRPSGREFSDSPVFEPSAIIFSRVGFNPGKNRALFCMDHQSSPGTSYFVLMNKEKDRWVIHKIFLKDLKIY